MSHSAVAHVIIGADFGFLIVCGLYALLAPRPGP
jgi:hypothetical protein